MTAITSSQITRYQLLVWRSAIKLEILGMRHSRGRWYTTNKVRNQFKLSARCKPQDVLTKLEEHINSLEP